MKTEEKGRCPCCGYLRPKRRIIENGDFYYLQGKSTRVMVIDYFETDEKVKCKIVEASHHSKYKIGSIQYFPRNILYPLKGKKWKG